MWSLTPDEQAVSKAFEQESERVISLVRGSRDLREPVPGLKWTVGQLAAHLTAVYLTFGATMRGDYQDARLTTAVAAAVAAVVAAPDGARGLPATVAAANEYAIEQLAVDSPEAAADGLAVNAAALLTALAGQDDLAREVDTPWYGEGMTRSVGTLASLAVTESLVHGRDLARAMHADARMSQASAAAATPTVMSAMLPLLFDANRAKGLEADYEVRLRGAAGFLVRIADGTAECSDALERGERKVDCVISLDPRAALLVGFGRCSLARAIVSGGALSTGRRPWLGLRFTTLFATP
ncbi:maleylpyruvate isomerase N-terminal domain-containing protein [Actinospica sp. MGRD01-02]|uniref:Maleylpyruvate isomerase N-terminal domain-containing protein n=1 Tax=Actinospica acidithermotolerans TaxID=2828514 RepID=A0A941EHP1_9ACTN|nr:maleylpyruvate isomerase N-terminal domain-containing protein [Actinospica acidithermotolerans]MBR7830598.1 maleylpyruvate isomerase N-terminal domain-containing protein [Actinospica acidithermotolerans]